MKRFSSVCAGLLFVASLAPLASTQQKAKLTSKAGGSESVTFNVYLPQQHRAELEQFLTELQTPGSPNYHKWLTPAEFQAQFGPNAKTVKAIQSELAGYGLTATLASAHRLQVTGNSSQVERALSTSLSHGVMPNGKQVLVATAPLNLPGSISSAGALVLDFSGTVRMHTNSKKVSTDNRYSQAGPYWFDDLKQAYDWPSYKVLSGKGTTIGILMSGGFSQADMNAYFGHENLASPKITVDNIFGGSPFDPSDGGTFEAELDIQQSGGMAPNANIVLYSIPDLSDTSIVAGLVQIIEEDRADVVNMSFSGPELFYTAAYNGGTDYTGIIRLYDDIFAEGNALGITFVGSSGDTGALTVPPLACFTTNANPCGNMLASVGFPASSPHVTGVGGTNLGTVTHPKHPDNLDSAYLYEEAFADPLGYDIEYGTTSTDNFWGSGGGDSIVFSKPDFQKLVPTGSKVRAVPDIALHMGGCPAAGDAICNPEDSADLEVLGGQLYGVIGTSASAPDFVGLTALNIENQGTRLGNENYYIYTLAAAQKSGLVSDVYRNTIPGYNGLYTSGNGGYNRVLGNGTPDGKNFLLLPNVKSAGVPQSPSNP